MTLHLPRIPCAAGIGGWLLSVLAIVTACSIGLRYGLMESDALHALCASANGDWRCAVRQMAPQLFIDHRIGWLAIAAAALALVTRSRMIASAAVVSGSAAVVLYSADFGAAGLLLGLIALAAPAREASARP